MLARKLFSTSIIKKIPECTNCRLVDKSTNLCKLNNSHWLSNRIDQNICGLDGIKFWEIDKTKLLQAERVGNNSTICFVIGITSIIPAIQINTYFLISSAIFCSLGDYYDKLYQKLIKEYNQDNLIK